MIRVKTEMTLKGNTYIIHDPINVGKIGMNEQY